MRKLTLPAYQYPKTMDGMQYACEDLNIEGVKQVMQYGIMPSGMHKCGNPYIWSAFTSTKPMPEIADFCRRAMAVDPKVTVRWLPNHYFEDCTDIKTLAILKGLGVYLDSLLEADTIPRSLTTAIYIAILYDNMDWFKRYVNDSNYAKYRPAVHKYGALKIKNHYEAA